MTTEPVLDEIDEAECWALLRQCTVGRLAVGVADAGPLVVPVNYAVDGDVIVFRTDPGTKLDAIARGPVSFEIDHFDHGRRWGWSVLVRGSAHEADVREVDGLELVPWTGAKEHWVRVTIEVITGRRVVLPSMPFDARGYR